MEAMLAKSAKMRCRAKNTREVLSAGSAERRAKLCFGSKEGDLSSSINSGHRSSGSTSFADFANFASLRLSRLTSENQEPGTNHGSPE